MGEIIMKLKYFLHKCRNIIKLRYIFRDVFNHYEEINNIEKLPELKFIQLGCSDFIKVMDKKQISQNNNKFEILYVSTILHRCELPKLRHLHLFYFNHCDTRKRIAYWVQKLPQDIYNDLQKTKTIPEPIRGEYKTVEGTILMPEEDLIKFHKMFKS